LYNILGRKSSREAKKEVFLQKESPQAYLFGKPAGMGHARGHAFLFLRLSAAPAARVRGISAEVMPDLHPLEGVVSVSVVVAVVSAGGLVEAAVVSSAAVSSSGSLAPTVVKLYL
jgi:hypothetical protein